MAEQDELNSTQDEPNPPEGWEEAVWKAYCKGNRNISDLCRVSEARGGSSRWHTIRKFVEKRRRDLALALAPEEERADYEAGLESDLQDADAIFNRAVGEGNTNGQIGALRAKMEAREKLAASRGVVTQRTRQEQTGAGGGPVQTQVVGVADVLANDNTIELACQMAEQLASGGSPDPGDAGTGT